MEEQLRLAFGRNPLLANIRISIMCRSTECQLQFVERTVQVQPEGNLGPTSLMAMSKVAAEPWFRENFGEWSIRQATPVAAQVAYQLVILPRRHP
jgi:hypothetical protein